MRLAHPWFLILLALIPLLLLHSRRRSRAEVSTLRYSDVRPLISLQPSWRVRLLPLATALRLTGIALLVVVLARPQWEQTSEIVRREGIDIMLTLDISLSMKARDFEPKDRITVAKEVIAEFVRGRSDDRLGLVVFSGHSFTQVPLTLDYQVLLNLLGQVDVVRRPDGTAIGTALAHSVDALRGSTAKSKVVILLTDGSNNRGDISPREAAEIARALDVRVYTILVGRPGDGRYPVFDPYRGDTYFIPAPNEQDEEALRQIAERTGGLFFRAGDEQALRQIYSRIDELERSEVASEKYVRYQEAMLPFAFAALAALIAELVLRATVLRSVS
ncbi:MAG: hypothetical protein KatS3mg057_2034 [Herpetosiphonaceae bacterium]|nr:MAG: hypothetical protein KatS3mg057_2034 [Herpetosiphonaceae bacterium]